MVAIRQYHDIQKIKEKETRETPDLNILDKALFWDTEIQHIDWNRQYRAVIQRVFERGSENQKNEVIRFYGAEKVRQAIQDTNVRSPYTTQ